MEFGLCCLFKYEPIKFKTYSLKKMTRDHILFILKENAKSLQAAIDYCFYNNIGSYRISSDIIPHFYETLKFVSKEEIKTIFSSIISHNVILSVHPGQYINFGSPHKNVIENSIKDIQYHLYLKELFPIQEINIHIGSGIYDSKEKTIKRFKNNIQKVYDECITLENDELYYSLFDVIDISQSLSLRTTYDIHHQRCFEIGSTRTSISNNISLAASGWGKYQRVHLSNPRDGYTSRIKARSHSDIITDFPTELNIFRLQIDIEAKFKEYAIKLLQKDLK